MANTRSKSVSTMNAFLNLAGTHAKPTLAVITTLLLAASCLAQDNSQPQPPAAPDAQTMQASAVPPAAIEVIPAGTRIALVLTHPIQSRYIHHGDEIYAQIISPVNEGNEMQIPPGTFVTGKVDKLELRSMGRAELHLQSMSITFADGYVAPMSGPVTLVGNEGYALKDPGQRGMVGLFVLPAAGAGLGALIGHSVGKPQSSVTSNFPPGCTGPPPYCTPETTPVFGTQGRDTAMGAGIGIAIGAVASFAMLASSHHFFLDAGAPLDMVLTQPLRLEQTRVSDAIQKFGQQPVSIQPVEPRPVFVPPPDTGPPPGMPGGPPMFIPGAPGPGGIPGPPIIIPGTPPSAP
ncbi:MAG: hypothetical protein ABSF93_07775 [Candidatus Sulfotelmatobacter sp.]|jgi:hypothetical protein